jgi:hypothetical protein
MLRDAATLRASLTEYGILPQPRCLAARGWRGAASLLHDATLRASPANYCINL